MTFTPSYAALGLGPSERFRSAPGHGRGCPGDRAVERRVRFTSGAYVACEACMCGRVARPLAPPRATVAEAEADADAASASLLADALARVFTSRIEARIYTDAGVSPP